MRDRVHQADNHHSNCFVGLILTHVRNCITWAFFLVQRGTREAEAFAGRSLGRGHEVRARSLEAYAHTYSKHLMRRD